MFENWKKNFDMSFRYIFIKQTSLSFGMQLKQGINEYLLAIKLLCSQSEWVEIQNLSWMSNNIYCDPDEKDYIKQAYIVFIYVSLWEEEKRQNYS